MSADSDRDFVKMATLLSIYQNVSGHRTIKRNKGSMEHNATGLQRLATFSRILRAKRISYNMICFSGTPVSNIIT